MMLRFKIAVGSSTMLKGVLLKWHTKLKQDNLQRPTLHILQKTAVAQR